MSEVLNTPSVVAAPSTTPVPRVSIAPTIAKLTQFIIVAGLAGMFVSAVAGYTEASPVISAKYMNMFSISIMYLATLFFLFICVAAWSIRKPPRLGQRGKYSHKQVFHVIAATALLGVLWSCYTAYIEIFVLQALCMLCIITQGLFVLICIATLIALGTIAEDMRERNVCEFC